LLYFLITLIILITVGAMYYWDVFGLDKFPVLLQDQPYQCGPVCLKIICQHHGRAIPLKQLESMTNMTPVGTSLLDVSEAAKILGLKTLGIRLNYNQFLTEAPLPAIAHLDKARFVVVYKIKKNKVYISDPALGKITYRKKEFCQRWWVKGEEEKEEGVALLIETTDAFLGKNRSAK